MKRWTASVRQNLNMRFEVLEIQDFSDDFRTSDFKVFAGALESGGAVKAFNAKDAILLERA